MTRIRDIQDTIFGHKPQTKLVGEQIRIVEQNVNIEPLVYV
jgi:hypothetical protein